MRHLTTLIDRLAILQPDLGLHLYPEGTQAPVFLAYRELARRVREAGATYRARGLQRGSAVLVPLETSVDAIVGLLGLSCIGATALCVKPVYRGVNTAAYAAFLKRVADQHRVEYVWDAPSLGALPLHCERLPVVADTVMAGADWPQLEPAESDIAFVQFSSGSTSLPKGIPIAHEQLIRQLELICAHDRRSTNSVIASWLPLFHDMGLVGALFSSLHGGSSLHLCPPGGFLMDPLGWLRLVSERRVSCFPIPNFGIEYLLRAIAAAEPGELQGLSFSSLEHVYVGAEPIQVPALRSWVEFLAARGMRPEAVQPAYGMAEIVLMATGGRDRVPRVLRMAGGEERVSVGPPLPGVELRISGADAAGVGEIELRGGTLAGRYFEAATSFFNADGYYPTGDLGLLSDDELFVLGRTNDRLKLAGETYFAHDLEHVIEQIPGIRARRSVVVQSGSQLFVLLEVARAKATSQLRREVSAALFAQFGFSIPASRVVFLRAGQIQRTSSGKLQRSAMLSALERGVLSFIAGGSETREAARHGSPQHNTAGGLGDVECS